MDGMNCPGILAGIFPLRPHMRPAMNPKGARYTGECFAGVTGRPYVHPPGSGGCRQTHPYPPGLVLAGERGTNRAGCPDRG